MSNAKKFVFLAASLLLITGVIGMVFTYSSAYEKTTVQQEKTVEEAFDAIDVQIGDATVEIIPTDEDYSRIVMDGQKYKKDSNEELTVNVKDDKLSVKQKNSGYQLINFDFFQPTVSLKVYIPQKQYTELHVSGDNGKIDVRDVQVDHIGVQTGNGIIKLYHVSGETVKAHTGNGKLQMDQVDGTITGSTSNGIISMKTTDLDRDIDLKSSNGLIDIKTENEPTNTTFVTDTGNGTINILDKYKEDTVIGDGEHKVELTTGNGKITVTKMK